MLTPKQRDLLKLIHERVQTDGVVPSYEEMRKELKLTSKSGVHRLVTALEERGFIRRLANKARAIEITNLPEALDQKRFRPSVAGAAVSRPARQFPGAGSARHALDVPVMGQIAAGTPIEAIQHVSHHVSVPGSMLDNSAEHYALDVKGDSMINAGINDGDVVIIRHQHDADSGDIVVALVEDQEATLKRLRKHGDVIKLEAENKDYVTQVYRRDQVRIQGRLVGLLRTY